MRWHWQNLNDRKDGSTGSGFKNGRAWLYFGVNSVLGVQWVFRPYGIGADVTFGGGEHDFGSAFHFALFSLYIHGERVLPRRWIPNDYDGHGFGLLFYFDGCYLRWSWNENPMEFRSRDAWWRRGSFYVLDFLLGRHVYREGEPKSYRISVPMPEGSYTGTCVMRYDSWKRPRWFRKTVRRAHIDMDEGQQVPFPGKGENSWDCGQDGIFGMTCTARDVPDAISQVYASAMRSRERYGGPNWKPELEATA
jgi:hypothetical protein